jgi:hypothetical protein
MGDGNRLNASQHCIMRVTKMMSQPIDIAG